MYRPATPSPLSSPIRAMSPPLSTRHQNTPPRRETQSSPIPMPKSRFAARPARPNPLMQKRESAQDSRRRLFLKNVRQRADDQKWARRGVDQELLKLEWWSLNRELRQAKNSDMEGFFSDAEIEDAIQSYNPSIVTPEVGQDEMLVDAMAQEEEAELDALISSIAQPPPSDSARPGTPYLPDDEDYDALFMRLLSQEDDQGITSSGDIDML